MDRTDRKLRSIDLFCGAGGMSLGFEAAGFQNVLALDNDAAAVATFRSNFPGRAECCDIEEYCAGGDIPHADVVFGGPPCQGFSLLNKQRRGDVRRALWQPYMDIVEASGASVFIIENVPGLHKSEEEDAIRRRAEGHGFAFISGVLNAADYGVPQARRRAILIGWRSEAAPEFPPAPTHSQDGSNGLPRWLTVWDAIADLPNPRGTEIRNEPHPFNLHFGRSPTKQSVLRYKAVPPGGNRFDLLRNAPELTPACWVRKKSGGTDLFGRLWWDRPSVTIRTEFFKPEKGRYLHPDEDRPITHREAARLMGFPDDFIFCGSKIEIARQIGNAVPPGLGAGIARSVRALLAEEATTLPSSAKVPALA